MKWQNLKVYYLRESKRGQQAHTHTHTPQHTIFCLGACNSASVFKWRVIPSHLHLTLKWEQKNNGVIRGRQRRHELEHTLTKQRPGLDATKFERKSTCYYLNKHRKAWLPAHSGILKSVSAFTHTPIYILTTDLLNAVLKCISNMIVRCLSWVVFLKGW